MFCDSFRKNFPRLLNFESSEILFIDITDQTLYKIIKAEQPTAVQNMLKVVIKDKASD